MRKESFGAWIVSPVSLAYWAAFAFVGALFTLKYVPRIHLNAFATTLAYWVFLSAQILIAARVGAKVAKSAHPKRILFAGLAIYLAAALTVYLRMDPLALRADRWSSLVYFWDFLLHGRYPYQTMSHLGHPLSGFPAWFIVALPFYVVGDVGLMQFAGLLAFAILLLVKFGESRRPTFLLGILLGLPVFEYEVFVRSELFTNMVLVAWLIHLGSKPERSQGRGWLLWAVIWGLMLSTRGIVFIPLLLASPLFLRGRNWKNALVFFAVVFGTFLATFAPFYLWDSQLFWLHNPYNVQSGYIPRWALALVLLTTCFLAYRNRENPRPFLHSAVLLYLTVLTCLFLKALEVGWVNALWGSYFDISYFSLSVPFLLLSWGELLPASKSVEL